MLQGEDFGAEAQAEMGLLFFLKPFFFWSRGLQAQRILWSRPCSPCSCLCVSVSLCLLMVLTCLPLQLLAPPGVLVGSRDSGEGTEGPSPSPVTPGPRHTFVLCFTIHPFTSFPPALPLSLSQSHLAFLIFHLSGFPIPDSTLASLCSTPIKHTQHRWNKVPGPL